MTQIATVEQILNPQYAIVSVPRKSACGHDCEECAGCGVTGAAVRAKAANPIGAAPGQKVVVQSDTKKMLRIVALVYLTPVVLFLAGYLLTALLVFLERKRLAEYHIDSLALVLLLGAPVLRAEEKQLF